MLKANIKTNAKVLQKKYKRLEKKLPRLIDKGLLQAGFHLLDIIKKIPYSTIIKYNLPMIINILRYYKHPNNTDEK